MSPVPDPASIRRDLLSWYDANARTFPWRTSPKAGRDGAGADPYRVWLSEIMLQQTTTAHAAPFFQRFTSQWPTVEALAAAADDEVMAAWAGLGYYARARNLLACARAVVERHAGRFPDDETGLRTLPGVGAYTAAAVAAIAFNQPATVVDANVERVVSRLYAVETPLPGSKATLTALAAGLVHTTRPGDWAQAMMDLGATICGPKQPKCQDCPIATACRGRALGVAGRLPQKAVKAERPRRYGVAYVLVRDDQVALVRRPPEGLLGGMLALPTSRWSQADGPGRRTEPEPGAKGALTTVGSVEHVFTHFTLTLDVRLADEERLAGEPLVWTPIPHARRAMPTVFKKVLALVLQGEGAKPAPRGERT